MKLYIATPINARPEQGFRNKYKAAQKRVRELKEIIKTDHAWQSSKGCNLEYRAAKIYDKEIYEHDKL